jgi:hypothetical protein
MLQSVWRLIRPLGRAKVGGTVQYGIPNVQVSAVATTAIAANIDRIEWFEVTTPVLLDDIRFETTVGPVGAATVYAGIYRATTDLQPTGAPLASGSVAVGSGAASRFSIPIGPVTLSPGVYCKVLNTDQAMTLRRLSGGISPVSPLMSGSPVVGCLTVARVAAAFGAATAGDSAVSAASGLHLLVLRWT